MKDAKGHGSSGRGASRIAKQYAANARALADYRAPLEAAMNKSGGQPMSSNADAAQSLMSGLKSTQAPVHDAMVGVGPNSPLAGSRDYDPFGRPRADKSEYDEGTRDMQLRSRNGQLGSGMKFRG